MTVKLLYHIILSFMPPCFFLLSFLFLRMHKLQIKKKVRHVDHISEADADNDKCKLLNFQVPAIDFSGGGTHTADALKQAKVSCACVGWSFSRCVRIWSLSCQIKINFMTQNLLCDCVAEHFNESPST